MLILTRFSGETLVIGDNIEVTILGVKSNQVQLGISAPRGIAVHREEIYRIINEHLAQPAGNDQPKKAPTAENAYPKKAQATPKRTPKITFKRRRVVVPDHLK
ncbi:MAG: carbon storage regulator CsrA [Candidatus Thiodiazotropha sp. (ex Dulcina madagascariensis)]|nr:carbon storage regulator CsrA [Candidatus Thiodiazotropha sp. (ex Dulcina madagascariensis)]